MPKPYYQDNKVTVLNGHVITELRSLPDEAVHMVCTSPPYWGLRDYGLPPQVWEPLDPRDCPHEWGDEILQVKEEWAHGPNQVGDNPNPRSEGKHIKKESSSQFCQKCNAWRGSLGLEPTPELYIQHIVQVFREIWRVLRSDGVIFLNLGDSYWGGKGQSGQKPPDYHHERQMTGKSLSGGHAIVGGPGITVPKDGKHPTLKPKDLCGIPWRVALALQSDGWWLRSDIIWAKPNPMPESVNSWRWEKHRVKVGRGEATEYKPAGWDTKEGSHDKIDGNYQDRQHEAKYEDCPGCPKCTPNDGFILRKGAWRPTSAHEYVFMLTKSDTYFCDADAVREPHSPDGKKDTQFKGSTKYANGFGPGASMSPLRGHERWPKGGRNLRSVWTIATQPFKDAHFATFPEKLVEPCIKAGTSEKGCCPECGAPWVRVVEKGEVLSRGGSNKGKLKDANNYGEDIGNRARRTNKALEAHESKTIGWRSTCVCLGPPLGKWPIPCTVLDPFGGSGRTAIVAKKLGRKAIIIELKPEYCSMPLDELRQENIY